MTELQLLDDNIKTLEAEKMIIRICRDQLNGMELDDIIDKYVFELKGTINDTSRQNNELDTMGEPESEYDPDGQRDLDRDNNE